MFRHQLKGAQALHNISAAWTLFLAFLLVADVLGRAIFSQPVPGTKELIQNSIVMIAFLQLPLAIYSDNMLRTSLLLDAVPVGAQRILRTLASLVACGLFLGILWGTWPSFIDAYHIGEYEGEGALRVPTWPVRGVIGVMSAVAIVAYAQMIVLDWLDRGLSDDDVSAADHHAS
ncbi:TRAP transporter small permease [Nitratireductor kimnyeongensis]|uniref:TRAP transporter small permease protein n=1 Tax=Nitratireductor kimnyeongensis TaxID=430679 RepID=A0ABW0T7S8_9HYPH|nr:TRAP transporter small permease [Nitratireductor kimnyeongensis]QZZ34382.1 TRAP transporter small permease [Nitratireductor kimnyeongensis]